MLCFRKFPLAKKFMEKKGGEGVSQFSVESFLSHTAEKTFVVEPFSLSFISGMESIYDSEGYLTIFRRKFFVSQCRGFF